VFRKAKQSGLVGDVVSQIEEAIIEYRLKPGDKLPSPQELQDTLGTSRGTLREAFRILAQKGLIETRPGFKGGAFVRETSTKPVSEGLDLLIRQRKISIEDFAEFRKVVEAGLIKLVAEKVTETDIEELRTFLEEFEEYVKQGPPGWKGFIECEVRLRKVLIRISGNRMYEAVLVPIHENILSYSYKYLPGEIAKIDEAFQDWCSIIEALEKHDGATAALVTQDHIARYAERMKHGRDAMIQIQDREQEQRTSQP
jgi:DNA-binding FadR family transcriptional regulator